MELSQKRIMEKAVNELLNEEVPGLIMIKRKEASAFMARGTIEEIASVMAIIAEKDVTGTIKKIILMVAEYFRYKENEKTSGSEGEIKTKE